VLVVFLAISEALVEKANLKIGQHFPLQKGWKWLWEILVFSVISRALLEKTDLKIGQHPAERVEKALFGGQNFGKLRGFDGECQFEISAAFPLVALLGTPHAGKFEIFIVAAFPLVALLGTRTAGENRWAKPLLRPLQLTRPGHHRRD
jgi:hypothetical protein